MSTVNFFIALEQSAFKDKIFDIFQCQYSLISFMYMMMLTTGAS